MLVLVALITVLTALPAAAVTRIRVYRGETSASESIKFSLARFGDGRFLKGYGIDFTLTCEDGTTQTWGMGVGWGGRGPRLVDGVTLDIDEVYGSDATHIHGRIGQHRGTGTFQYTVAQLTEDEQAQVCTTGELTWAVEYDKTIRRGRFALRPGSGLDGFTRVRVTRNGEASFEVTRY